MDQNQQFKKDGFSFEVISRELYTVTILSHTGVYGHLTKYFDDKPIITNDKVIFIPDSIVDDYGQRYSVTSISRGVFDSLTDVEEIYIPASIKEIAWSFWRCQKLKGIFVEHGNQNYEDIDGVLYLKGLKRLIAFPSNYAKSYSIVDGVEEIANMAFKSSNSIEVIKLPGTMKKIGINVFYGCVNLKHVYGIPDELLVFDSNTSNRPINAIFHYKDKEWSLYDIVDEFKKEKTHFKKSMENISTIKFQ